MPRAHLSTALPTRQEPTSYEMLRFPAVFQFWGAVFSSQVNVLY